METGPIDPITPSHPEVSGRAVSEPGDGVRGAAAGLGQRAGVAKGDGRPLEVWKVDGRENRARHHPRNPRIS